MKNDAFVLLWSANFICNFEIVLVNCVFYKLNYSINTYKFHLKYIIS